MENNLNNKNDSYFMRMALDQANQAFTIGEVPVGAVMVQQGEVIATGFNRREVDQDPTAHAEMIAIREASSKLGSWRLNDTTLYVTLEPCAMCAGAMIQARVSCRSTERGPFDGNCVVKRTSSRVEIGYARFQAYVTIFPFRSETLLTNPL